jgi:hypothetical protein
MAEEDTGEGDDSTGGEEQRLRHREIRRGWREQMPTTIHRCAPRGTSVGEHEIGTGKSADGDGDGRVNEPE